MNFTALQERQRAEQMVKRFVNCFQSSYRLLAYYAALPLLLTPELVNYLRVEFLRDRNIPWVAEVDLLLSDLCRPVGYELYAMDTAVRAYLLEKMEEELGIERMQEVAKSLIGYVRYLFQDNPYISVKELQAQQWAAMVYLEETREQVVREIAENFENYATSVLGKELINIADLARLARITKELAPQLINYQNLLGYAEVVSKIVVGTTEIKSEDIRRSYQILPDIELRLPNDLIPDKLKFPTPASISPFSPRGAVTNSRDFFDREELLQQIFQILAQGGNIYLLGESAIGKTSILHQICNQGKERLHSMGARTRDFVYFNLQLVANEREFYEALCDVLEIPFSQGHKLVRALRNKYYVLCLDEIEKLNDSAFTSKVRSQLRALANGIDEPLKLIIAGRSPLDILFPDISTYTSPLYNILTQLNVEPFSLELTAAFLNHYLVGTGIEFSQEQINQLFIETRGRPGRLLEAGDKLYRQIISSSSNVVNLFSELHVFEFETARVEIKQRRKLTGLVGHSYKTEIIRSRGNARYFSEPLDNGINLEMVLIPGGSFMMGAPKNEEGSRDRERPQHQVTVPTFFMGKYPVTQTQWKFVAALPQVKRLLKPDPSYFKENNRPVERVFWFDAVEFCDRLSQYTGKNYRLPSEAEWEYACRAGTTTPFHFGETITSELANYDASNTYGEGEKGIYREETTDVGSFGVANDFGLYDMHGNLWEWCADQWHKNYEGAPKDGSAWIDSSNNNDYWLLRGGSWSNNPAYCRCAYRYVNRNPENVTNAFGLRVVCGVLS